MKKVDHSTFIFNDLPAYSKWLKETHLHDLVTLGIQYSYEENLPILKPLSKYSREEIVAMSMESYMKTLEAMATNTLGAFIQHKLDLWLSNSLIVLDKDEVVAEDISIGSYIRRKIFHHFLEEYTSDRQLYKRLVDEIDTFTTREEVVLYSNYNIIQQEKLQKINEELALHENLLLEAQEIGEMGSYLMDFVNPSKSVFTPQYRKILETSGPISFEEFISGVHPHDREYVRSTIEHVLINGGELEISYRFLARSKEKYIWSKGVAVAQEGKPVSLKGTIRDITKHHKLLEQLRESDRMHKLAQELTHLGNWTWDIGKNKITWSDEMYRIYGLVPQSEEISFDRFASMIHPDYRENRLKEIETSLKTLQAPDYILCIVTPDGTHKMLRGRGWVETDYKNDPVKLHGTCQDITTEHILNSELLSLNETLSAKNTELERINAELESFNYVASHDLKEPLRKIHTFTSLVLEEKENISERGKLFLHKILSSASTMQRLISDLIDFSQVSSLKESFEKTDLIAVVEEVRNTLSEAMEESRAVIRIKHLPALQVIRFQFLQLFTNIISNAIKYRKEDVPPEISIDSEIVLASELNNPKYKDHHYLIISVSDNGIGFEEEYKERIFDLFQRLHNKGTYSGTGIGLAICKKIVQQHNGFIEAESEKGKGSVFKIILPAKLLV